jgi:hypothetical protein
MKDNDYAEYKIVMNMLKNYNGKNYLIVIATNTITDCDCAIVLIQESSYIYCNKYVLDDFKKINFFGQYIDADLGKCIETLIELLKQKKHLIILEESNDAIKLVLDIEYKIEGTQISLPKEKIELTLSKDNDKVDENTKMKIIWYNLLHLYQEKEDNYKIKGEKDIIIEQLKQEANKLAQDLKNQNMKMLLEDSNNRNGLKKSQILTEKNIKDFDFVRDRLKENNENKKLDFEMLYSAKKNGDTSSKFHELCDNQNNTLIIIKTKTDNIFGGFARKTWNSMETGRKKDNKSFLFSLRKKKIFNPKRESNYHLFCSDRDGPCFYAFSIENESLKNGGFCDEIYKCNYDSFENEYELNNGVKKFFIDELEVFKVDYI